MKAWLSPSNLARVAVLVIVTAALSAIPQRAAAQYFPPLQYYNNGLSIHVPYVRLFPGYPAYPAYSGSPPYAVPDCLLDRQVRVLLNDAGFHDVSFYGYASTRAHARAVKGQLLYQLIVHRCTHQIISAVPIGQV